MLGKWVEVQPLAGVLLMDLSEYLVLLDAEKSFDGLEQAGGLVGIN